MHWTQGRFSGRLTSKEDEARLAAECAELAPLLGGHPEGSRRNTLSLIVRSIARGEVREFLERQQREQEVWRSCRSSFTAGACRAHVACHGARRN